MRLVLPLRQGVPRWWKLAALCVGLNLAETALVVGFDPGMRPFLAPQASAIAPFGIFGDMRWVSVYHDSWPALIGELTAMLVVRGAITALTVALAWPARLPRPPARALLSRAILASALAAVLLAPSVALLFGLAVVPVSWLFLAAVPAALLVAFILHPAAVSNDWWQRLVAPRAIGWVVLAFFTLTVAGAVVAATPAPLAPFVAVLSGLFNAWSWTGLVEAVTDRPPVKRVVPVAALCSLALIGAAIGGAVLGFSLARNAEASTLARRAVPTDSQYSHPGARPGIAVLVVSGYGSDWDGSAVHPIPGNFVEERFSYKGLSAQGMPLPYTSADTAKPILQLDRMLLSQVDALSAQAGEPVDVIAESEGALIAKTALIADPDVAVGTLVMASPLEEPGRVWYPTTGSQGWGVASDEAMRLMSDAFQGVAPIDLSPSSPLLASLDGQAPLLQNALSCPINGVHQFALLPLADATVTPATEQLPFPSVVLPAFHGGLLETTEGEQIIARVLTDRPVGQDQLMALADKVISYAASAWQVPSLAPSDYPGGARGRPDGRMGCTQVAVQLRAALSRAR